MLHNETPPPLFFSTCVRVNERGHAGGATDVTPPPTTTPSCQQKIFIRTFKGCPLWRRTNSRQLQPRPASAVGRNTATTSTSSTAGSPPIPGIILAQSPLFMQPPGCDVAHLPAPPKLRCGAVCSDDNLLNGVGFFFLFSSSGGKPPDCFRCRGFTGMFY